MRVLARTGFWRVLLGSGRTPAWDQASKDYKKAHPNCAMCGLRAGQIPGNYDGSTGVQAQIEFHDVKPWHLLTKAQQNDYKFLMTNGISLHHWEHHRYAHGCDPVCQKYDPNIRQFANVVLAEIIQCVT